MDDLQTGTSADATRTAEAETSTPAAHLADGAVPAADEPARRRRWLLPALLVPLVLLVLLVIAWAVDSGSGEVARNVQLAQMDVGGLSQDELAGRIDDLAERFTETPVLIDTGSATYETTAGEIGLVVDKDETAQSALDIDADTVFPLRPFLWARSLVTERNAEAHFQVDAEQLSSTVVTLQGDDRIPPTEPSVELVDGAFDVVPGVDGRGIDPSELAERLPLAAQRTAEEGAERIRIEVTPGPLPPLGSLEAASDAAEAAEELVQEAVEVVTSGGSRTIQPAEMRTWVRLSSTPDGAVVVAFDRDATNATLRRAFADVEGHPEDASFTLAAGGVPVIRPDRSGLVCCGGDAAVVLLAALQAGQRSVELTLVEGPAAFTTADAEAYGIIQAVGGNHAWRSGAPTTDGPGFTTYHDATGARITNIHRIADLVRGVVIPPGGSFSVNDHVGERTREKGFVPAGAIRNGEHVDEVGGGISQFATTTFNAVYFAGLQIDDYQAHSEYFDRYPRGREATMGYPRPDLKFTNNTPYGILIWTSYTSTSLTITLYSTPYATAEQTGITEGMSGRCTVVTTTRTRTFPDGHTENDKFRARYRPGPGQGC